MPFNSLAQKRMNSKWKSPYYGMFLEGTGYYFMRGVGWGHLLIFWGMKLFLARLGCALFLLVYNTKGFFFNSNRGLNSIKHFLHGSYWFLLYRSLLLETA